LLAMATDQPNSGGGPVPPSFAPYCQVPHAAKAVANPHWVQTKAELHAMMEQMKEAQWVGLDTEFVRERTYFPTPGLLQVSDGAKVWLVDVVALPNLDLLAEWMNHHGGEFIFHSLGEDLEILSILMKEPPTRLFDTQLAAALLGFPTQMRYEHLVKAVFDVELPGGQARANWCRRPLSASMLEYAAHDVIYLPKLAECLSQHLSELGRLAWLEEDCQRLIERRRSHHSPPLYTRIKGAGRLSDGGLAYLKNLANWRDQQARARNIPRSFILKDDAMIDLAGNAERLSVNEALSNHRKTLGTLFSTCQSSLESAKVNQFRRSVWLKALSPEQRQQLKHWQQQVKTIGQSLNIDPTIIASKNELTRLLHGESAESLNGWRRPYLDAIVGVAGQTA
jgi:ribonuclease D